MLRLPRPNLKVPIRRTGGYECDEQVLSRGQIIVLFAASLFVLIGIMGLAIDFSYAWINEMRDQKAADAGALAGAVYLPDAPSTAKSASLASTVQNGYTNLVGGVVIDAHQDSVNGTQMDVTISAPVPTFFLRLFNINSLTVTRTSHAQFQLPVPMGSPLSAFGCGMASDPSNCNKDLQGNLTNFWADIAGPCTIKSDGDAYATKNDGAADCATAPITNTEYRAPAPGNLGAYDYAINVPVAGPLTIQLYDPEFCPRTSQTFDTGDESYATSNFTTSFWLYDPSSTPYDLADDVLTSTGSANPAPYPGNGVASTNTTDKADSCSAYYVTGSSGELHRQVAHVRHLHGRCGDVPPQRRDQPGGQLRRQRR